MIHIKMSEQEIAMARKYERELEKLKDGLDSTWIGTKDYRAVGKLGEWAVEKYCLYNKIPYAIPNESVGRHKGDTKDIIIGKFNCDVKTTKKWHTITVNGKPMAKAVRDNIHFFIGVKASYDLKDYILYGYGKPSDMQRIEDVEYNGEIKEMWAMPQDKLIKFKVENQQIFGVELPDYHLEIEK